VSEANAQNVGTQLQLRPETARPVRKPRPRLNRADYLGRRTYHVTITANERAELLDDLEFARDCNEVLRKTAVNLRFRLLAYCFMPDHVHILLQGNWNQSDLIRFVQRFKQITGYRFKHETGDHLWQQSFRDRVLRKDENRDVVAQYILDNPSDDALPLHSPAYELRGGELYQRLLVPDGAKAASLHSVAVPGGSDD
jgi:putative transposase